MLSRKDSEDLLSSFTFLVSCMERMETRLSAFEKRLKTIEKEHDRIVGQIDVDGMVQLSRDARSVMAAFEAARGGMPALVPTKSAPLSLAVVVPVHNAHEEVAACLAALFENGGYSQLVVVDDASDEAMQQMLAHESGRRNFDLVTNETNKGYTASINIGLRRCRTADIVVFLNSDTVTTVGWTARIIEAFSRDRTLGIAGPWSNAANYQSVPHVKDGSGAFAIHQLGEGLTPDDIALSLKSAVKPTYPGVPTVNGFCFAVRRSVFDEIGVFDEQSFPVGYGEENDLCLRAAKAGYKLAVVDDAFVFHAKSSSFGHERRKVLSAEGRAAIDRKHGPEAIPQAVRELEGSEPLETARDAAAKAQSRATTGSLYSGSGLSVAYLLPARPGGGGVHSIVQEAHYLLASGVPSVILVPERERVAFIGFYSADGVPAELFQSYRSLSEVRDVVASYSTVVATVYKSVTFVRELMDIYPGKQFAYYIQDYEPFFHEEGSAGYGEALASYDIDSRCRFFAKTRWLQDIVRARHGREVSVVLPSLDHGVYYPGSGGRQGRVAAMVRPSTPRRRPVETVAFALALLKATPEPLDVTLFGADPADPVFDAVRNNPAVTVAGRLRRPEVADVFRRSDIFVDLSTYQAFGRASLEAMACGCAAVIPLSGGGAEYALEGWNSMAVDTSTDDSVGQAVAAVLTICSGLEAFKANALRTASRYSTESAARSIVKFFLQAQQR